jgi:hypothetical protein
MQYLKIALLLVIAILAKCQDEIPDEGVFKAINGLTVLDEEGVNQILKTTDMTYFVYVFSPASINSRKGGVLVAKVAQKLDFLAGIILINCDNFKADKLSYLCEKSPEAQDGFPKMFLYVPPEYKINPYTRKVNEHTIIAYDKNDVSELSIYNFITPHINSRSVALNSDNVEDFLSNPATNKLILFSEKNKTPLMWRGLSNYFFDRLQFGHVEKNQVALYNYLSGS